MNVSKREKEKDGVCGLGDREVWEQPWIITATLQMALPPAASAPPQRLSRTEEKEVETEPCDGKEDKNGDEDQGRRGRASKRNTSVRWRKNRGEGGGGGRMMQELTLIELAPRSAERGSITQAEALH